MANTDGNFKSISCQEIHLAEVGNRNPALYASGALICSGAKLLVKGAADWETVTSS